MQWVNQLLLLQKHQETTCCRLENIPTPNPHKLKFDACITPTQTHSTITPMYFTSLVYTVQTSFSFFMHHSSINSLLFTFRNILQLQPLYFTPFVYMQNKVTKEWENWNIAYFRQLNGLKFSEGVALLHLLQSSSILNSEISNYFSQLNQLHRSYYTKATTARIKAPVKHRSIYTLTM